MKQVTLVIMPAPVKEGVLAAGRSMPRIIASRHPDTNMVVFAPLPSLERHQHELWRSQANIVPWERTSFRVLSCEPNRVNGKKAQADGYAAIGRRYAAAIAVNHQRCKA